MEVNSLPRKRSQFSDVALEDRKCLSTERRHVCVSGGAPSNVGLALGCQPRLVGRNNRSGLRQADCAMGRQELKVMDGQLSVWSARPKPAQSAPLPGQDPELRQPPITSWLGADLISYAQWLCRKPLQRLGLGEVKHQNEEQLGRNGVPRPLAVQEEGVFVAVAATLCAKAHFVVTGGTSKETWRAVFGCQDGYLDKSVFEYRHAYRRRRPKLKPCQHLAISPCGIGWEQHRPLTALAAV